MPNIRSEICRRFIKFSKCKVILEMRILRNIQFGFSDFLKQVGCFMRLVKPNETPKFFLASSSTLALKSPRRITLSYLEEWISSVLLIIPTYLKYYRCLDYRNNYLAIFCEGWFQYKNFQLQESLNTGV